MEIINLCRKYYPIKTAHKASRYFGNYPDACYISEGTPNKRFEPLSATGWELVTASTDGDRDFEKALDMLRDGYSAVFIRTSSVAGYRQIYVAKDKYREYEGQLITIQNK